jgi:hypothetical protein
MPFKVHLWSSLVILLAMQPTKSVFPARKVELCKRYVGIGFKHFSETWDFYAAEAYYDNFSLRFQIYVFANLNINVFNYYFV